MELFERFLAQDEFFGQAVLVIWTSMLGACVGSFLNVVIYRVPLGMSVAYPGSRCPRCGKAIRAWDNVPLFSWLLLKGRCRNCRTEISARYPIVELTIALVFATLAVRELVQRGANLPWNATEPAPALLAITFVYHACLMTLSVAMAWISFDGHPLPRQLLAFGMGLALVVPAVWPDVHPVPAIETALNHAWYLDSILGLAAGLLCGGVVAWSLGEHITRSRPQVALVVGMWGAVLGWQAIWIVGGVLAALVGTLRLCKASSGIVFALAAITALAYLWLVNWAVLSDGLAPRLVPTGVCLSAFGVLLLLAGKWRHRT